MAILRAINPKKSGRTAFLETLEYVSNPEKGNCMSTVKASNFQKQTLVNRVLLGKEFCKRHFKQFVVSLEETWPIDDEDREQIEYALIRMADLFKQFWQEQGYITEVWIHCNTEHPHFHLMLETCNAFSGKQFSQSTSELLQLKGELNSYLEKLGFSERVRGSITEISEEELFEEGENDWFKRELEWYEEELENFEDNEIVWHTDTVARPLREMVTYVANNCSGCSPGRQMVRIVTEEEKAKGREMVRIVPDITTNNTCITYDNDYDSITESAKYLKKVTRFMQNSK